MRYKLLIVDDEHANLRLLERLFSRDYECLTASSAAEAIRLLEQHDVAIVITDQRMPDMTGIELLKQTAKRRPHMVRILLTGYTDVEALVEAINCGLVYMYSTKPWNNEDLKLRVSRAREHYENNRKRNALTQANERLLLRIRGINLGVVTALADMLASRDQPAYKHGLRVRYGATVIAEKAGLSGEERENLQAAALLLDLGPVERSMNLTPTRSDSMARARTHAECEAKLLFSIPELAGVADLVRLQIENFDGSGPSGMRDEQIPYGARILRVAAEYDSLLRPKALVAEMTHEEAMRFLVQRSARQFDPKVVEMLRQLGQDGLKCNQDVYQVPASARGYNVNAAESTGPDYSEAMIVS